MTALDEQMIESCPFCGGPGRIESSGLSTLSWPVWKHTDCPLNAAKMYPNPAEAAKAANTRAAHSLMAAKVAELEELLSMFVNAAGPRRQDGYHELPLFSAREIAIARAALAPHPEGTDQ